MLWGSFLYAAKQNHSLLILSPKESKAGTLEETFSRAQHQNMSFSVNERSEKIFFRMFDKYLTSINTHCILGTNKYIMRYVIRS